MDYADQRYFAGLTGRFLSSDPYEASGGAAEPGSWNRYPYVDGDPVNFGDSTGLMAEDPVQIASVTVFSGPDPWMVFWQASWNWLQSLDRRQALARIARIDPVDQNSPQVKVHSSMEIAKGRLQGSGEKCLKTLGANLDPNLAAKRFDSVDWQFQPTISFTPVITDGGTPQGTNTVFLNNSEQYEQFLAGGVTIEGVVMSLGKVEEIYGLYSGSLDRVVWRSIVMLHEYSHVLKKLHQPQDPTGPTGKEFMQGVIDNCFAYLKK